MFISGFFQRIFIRDRNMAERETIAAIATGLVDSGIGIIRISGREAVEIGDRVLRSPSGKKVLQKLESHRFYYGYVVEYKEQKEDQESDEVIDEVMVVVMRAPRSFTGENTVEIQCHGGVFVMKKILGAVLSAGAGMAEPGEFTKRAFLNGRIDLTKAEAVMDMIQSQNEFSLRSSMKQLRGGLLEKIRELRSKVLHENAFIEAALDDPENFSLEGYGEGLKEKLKVILQEIEKLLQTANDGRLMKEGIRTVIVGKPNAGKSSFLNFLVGEERAIVTEVAGTTRDALRESVRLGDICFHITDTAGIRETEDIVEKIGVDRARSCVEDADLVLYVVDGSVCLDENDRKIISVLKDKKFIVLLNKSDLENVVTESDLQDFISENLPGGERRNIVKTSAKKGDGLEEFLETVKSLLFQGEIKQNNEVVITSVRHKEALQEAYHSLILVEKSVQEGMPEDFYTIDLMNAFSALGKIIGEDVEDDLVEEIFSRFCIGK